MTLALVPHSIGGGLDDDGERVGGVGRRSHYACGIVSVVVVLATLGLSYSLVVAMTSAVPLLSTTAIVLLTALVWVLVWLLLDMSLLWWAARSAEE
jgi:ABC-type nickel/cobalt efflux system permease component RcnA